MATVSLKSAQAPVARIGSTPYGTLNGLPFPIETTSSGAVKGSDASQTGTTGIGDVVRVGVIPAGQRLLDLTATIKTAFTASVTANIGFAYCDGVDSTEVPQNASYFAAAAALSSAAVVRKTAATTSVTLPKDAFLTLTFAGATNAKAAAAEFVVFSVTEGTV